MKPGEIPYSILWKGVCWLHTTKSACEARQKASEAILGGVLWLHLGENPKIGAGKRKTHKKWEFSKIVLPLQSAMGY